MRQRGCFMCSCCFFNRKVFRDLIFSSWERGNEEKRKKALFKGGSLVRENAVHCCTHAFAARKSTSPRNTCLDNSPRSNPVFVKYIVSLCWPTSLRNTFRFSQFRQSILERVFDNPPGNQDFVPSRLSRWHARMAAHFLQCFAPGVSAFSIQVYRARGAVRCS